MPKLPAVDGRAVVKALRRAGFTVTRQRGSHVRLQHRDGRTTTVPVHSGRMLPKGTLRAILHDVELELVQFVGLL